MAVFLVPPNYEGYVRTHQWMIIEHVTKYQGLLSLSTRPSPTFLTFTYQPFHHHSALLPLMESLTVQRSWFPSGLDEGDRITLDKPRPSEWVIGKLVNKHSYQSDLMCVRSYACVQFECHNATDEQQGFMRIYVQVPHVGYEHADQATRAQEATEFTPLELNAYKYLTRYASQNTPHLLA